MGCSIENVKAEFEKEGFLTDIPVLAENELEDARNNFSEMETTVGKEEAQYSLRNIHLTKKWAMDLISHDKVIQIIKKLLGENVFLLDSRFICKYPKGEIVREDGSELDDYVAWHQDIKYWGIDNGAVISVWLALDDVDKENGCMTVIPETHKLGVLEHQSAKLRGNMLTSNQEIPSKYVDESRAVLCPLKAGSMSIHHGALIHASAANNSARRRCGFVLRFTPTCACPVDDAERPRKFPATVLVSGTDIYSNFKNNICNFS